MATSKTEAQKVTELRKQAQDKSLPQQVRDMADKKANEIEGRSVKKETGIELAKGGMAKKKFAVGGMASQIPLTAPKTGPTAPAPKLSMQDRLAKAGAVAKKKSPTLMVDKQVNVQPTKPTQPMMVDKQVNVQPTKPMMAKGGAVKKKYAAGGMASQIPLTAVKREPVAKTAAPKKSMADRVSQLSSMAKAAAAQPKKVGGMAGQRQAQAAYKQKMAAASDARKLSAMAKTKKPPTLMVDKQVNVQPTKPMMAKGGAVKKAKK